ncbi:MAG: FtsW/RodA/SpoVE family cell cycle protein, partial [Actinomycetes bacterium]
MTAGTRERPGSSSGPAAAESRRRYERPPSRLRGPEWLEGPMTSCHLVLGAGGLLLVIGLVMVFSASAIEAALADEPAWKPGVQQVIWAGLGLVAMLVALRLPVGFIRRWSPIAL